MKAHLTFSIELPYLQTEYELLKGMAIKTENLGHSRFLWTFRATDVERVIATLGKPIEFDLAPLIQYAPALKEVVADKSRKKGKGHFIILLKAPKIFIIETVINAKTITKKVPTENIQVLWDCIKKYPIGKPIKTRTIAENVCNKLGVTRFNRAESGSFCFELLFGNRQEYFLLLYYPAKCLESIGVLRHHKDGYMERLVENWDMQTEFQEVQI